MVMAGVVASAATHFDSIVLKEINKMCFLQLIVMEYNKHEEIGRLATVLILINIYCFTIMYILTYNFNDPLGAIAELQ